MEKGSTRKQQATVTRSARHLATYPIPVEDPRSGRHPIRRALLRFLVAGVIALIVISLVITPGLVRAADRIPARVHAVLRAHHAPYTPLSSISPVMQHAIIAVEDRRFYQNHGVDFHAVARALYTDISTWHFNQGGATLTDQLVERTVPLPANIIGSGFRILGVAVAANVRLGKARILDLYLNSVYYGRGAYGIGAAAETYFHRSPRALDVAQAAFLASLPQAPSYYARHPFAPVTRARWRTVIRDLLQQGYITPAQARAARREGIRLA